MLTENQKQFVSLVEEKFGADYVITRKEILSLIENTEFKFPQWIQNYRISHGKFKMPSYNESIENVVPMKKIIHKDNTSMIPEKDPNFVSFGNFNNLKKIISSKIFYPIYIFGESGYGKNMMIEQVCASLGRELIRINFSPETDQTALLGGPTLVDGNIIFNDGPVIEAMKRGYILFLDEFSKGNAGNIVILNAILDGKPYFNPHTKEYIHPADGFNIIAASNSNGRGDDSGKYLEQLMDDSVLERFPATFIQEMPTTKIVRNILLKHIDDENFVTNLIKWSEVIRKTHENGGIDALISIRRLVHICKAYKIFKNKLEAISVCVNRFEPFVRESFIDLYIKVDAGIVFDADGNLVEASTQSTKEFDPSF
jgi:hypothetical protein